VVAAAPLAGVRVVDLTSNIAAPFASAILADLGADVVHVESPHGDDSRRMTPVVEGSSAYFHVVNRNKTGRVVDLRDPADRAGLDDLIAESDVLVCNLRPGLLERHGLDSSTLSARFPRLIHASLSAYGAHGPERDRPGYDAVLQARTGIAAITGEPDGPPVRAGISVLDMGAGTWLALGVLAALLDRERTGRGGAVATSLFETGASWVGYHVVAHQVSGAASARHGSGHPAFAPYGIFRTGDGDICIGVGGDAVFARLCECLDRPQLESDPRFLTNAGRVANADDLRRIIEEAMSTLSATAVAELLDAGGVPADVVHRPEDLLRDGQAAANSVLSRVSTADGTQLTLPGLPFTLDGVRPAIRFAAPDAVAG